MPSDNLTLNPPIQYSWLWLIIGLCLLLAIAAWYGFAYWYTRKKKLASLATLPVLAQSTDLYALKAKYLALIDECYVRYKNNQVDLRGLHRGLSMTVRYFVYEANHFPAPRLTLQDFKYAPFPNLTAVIGNYYDKEFAAIESGNPEQSVALAKELIQRWA